MNEMDALLGLGITDEEELRAMSDALRGRKNAADFFSISTVPNIQRAAEGEQAAVYNAAKQAGLLRSRELDRQQRDREAMLRAASGGRDSNPTLKYFQSYRDKETGEVHKIGVYDNQLFDFTTGKPINDLSMFDPDPMAEGEWNRSLEGLDNRLDNAITMMNTIEAIDDMLEPYHRKGYRADQIPGLGWFEKAPYIGGVFRATQDVLSGSDEQGANYSRIRSLINQINVSRAGLTQTKTELGNIQAELGTDLYADPRVFVENLERIKKAIERGLKRDRALLAPSVRNAADSYFKSNNMEAPWNHKFRSFEWDRRGQHSLFEEQPELPDAEDVTDEEADSLVIKRVIPDDEDED